MLHQYLGKLKTWNNVKNLICWENYECISVKLVYKSMFSFLMRKIFNFADKYYLVNDGNGRTV